MDALDHVLAVARVRGVLLTQLRAYAPWGLDLSPTTGAAFHAILTGTCWIRLEGARPRQLLQGDVVMLPGGARHALLSAPEAATRPFDRLVKAQLRSGRGELVLGRRGVSTRVLCASYDFDHEVNHPLLSLLPAVLHLPAQPGDCLGAVQDTLRLLSAELAAQRPGASAVADRLIDVLFIHVLRGWLDAEPEGSPSWLTALRDPLVSEALSLMHAHPERPWTIDDLAGSTAVSRATLSRRFTSLVGDSPLAYLTRWRMDLAARWLRETDESLGSIAASVGYSSAFAFSRAFSRSRGQSPTAYRRAMLAARLTA
jgi:AraC-like DNA-binding protein